MNENRTVLITGCSTGFGRAAALTLARRGWRVFATVRTEADRQSLLAEASGEPLEAELCDVTQADQVAALARRLAVRAPRLKALINNAGTAYPGPVELMPLADLRAQLEINTVAPIAMTQAVLPLIKAGRGTIVNVSSQGGRVSFPINGAYCASKFALEALSDALRLEVAPFGVKVVVVEPGGSPTAIWQTGRERGLRTIAEGGGPGDYQKLIDSIDAFYARSNRRGFPPQRFADLVVRIIESPRPRARYVIPARVGWTIGLRYLLPDSAWDWMIRRLIGW